MSAPDRGGRPGRAVRPPRTSLTNTAVLLNEDRMVVGFAHTDTGEKYGPHVERLKREYHRRPGWNLIICGSYTPVLFGDMWDERKR